MRHRTRPATLLLALLLTLPLGCVTERSGSSRSFDAVSRTSSSGAPSSASRAPSPAPFPTGPVATPVTPRASVSARVRTSTLDLGVIPYDAQVLPLVSPDGLFVATQTGVAPTWPTLLAAPGAEVPLTTRVEAFALPDPDARPADATRGNPVATPIAWPEPRTAILLGRSCDTTGFLVEAPQPDGSRWIGRIAWVSGELTWLVRSPHVNSGATLGPAGELAYCRRDIESTQIELVVRPDAAQPRELVARVDQGAGAYFWPFCSDAPGLVYAAALRPGGAAELHALRLPRRGEPETLAVVARHPLVRNADAATLYQMTAPIQTPLPARTPAAANRQEPDTFDKALFFHPGFGTVAVYEPTTSSLVRLFPGSLSAIPVVTPDDPQSQPEQGYLITMPRGLEFIPVSRRSEFDTHRGVPADSEEGVKVAPGAKLGRLTTSTSWPVILLGPASGGDAGVIHLFRLRFVGTPGADAGP